MPDGLDFSYSDPRFLRQKIRALEKDIDTLKKQVMPFAIHQRGATAGAMRAISINDQGLASSMWMNFSNIGPGSGPYWAVTDASKVIRVEGGNLAANGVSPAQEGLRVNKGDGTPIFDSQGLIAVMMSLGREQFAPGLTVGGGNPATNVTITNSSLTFTLPRAEHVFALTRVLAQISAGTGATLGTVLFGVDGTGDGTNGTSMQWLGKNNTNAQPVSEFGFYFNSLAAGSHTINLLASVSPTTDSFFINAYDLIIFQMGS